MDIIIGKLGRSIYFNKEKWSIYAGDEEAPLLFIALAKAYPQHKFYMAGRSDLSTYRDSKRGGNVLFGGVDDGSLDIPENIIDLWDGFEPGDHQYVFTLKAGAPNPDKLNEKVAQGTYTITHETTKGDARYVYVQPKEDWHMWMENKIKKLGLKFGAGVIYQGPTPAVGIPNMGVEKVDEPGEAKTQLMFRMYYAPIMHILNIQQTPYVLLNADPRYIPLIHRDCFNDEKIILGQINAERTVKRISGYGLELSRKYRMVKTKYVYSGIETVFMLTEQKKDFRNIPKPHKFVMGLNGGGDREQIIKDWILDRPEGKEVKIYGKWDDEIVARYPGVFENKGIATVSDVFWGSRYTLIPPFYKGLGGFVTQKFWKMIVFGIIPFFHPNYDTDKIFDVPKILRVQSPSEMWERMKYLDEHPEEYAAVKEHLWKMLKDEYYDGSHMVNTVVNGLKNYGGIQL